MLKSKASLLLILMVTVVLSQVIEVVETETENDETLIGVYTYLGHEEIKLDKGETPKGYNYSVSFLPSTSECSSVKCYVGYIVDYTIPSEKNLPDETVEVEFIGFGESQRNRLPPIVPEAGYMTIKGIGN